MLSSEKKIVEQRAPGAVYDALPILGFPVAPTRTQNQRNTTKSFKSLLLAIFFSYSHFCSPDAAWQRGFANRGALLRVLTVSMCIVSAKGVEADPEPNDRAVNRGANPYPERLLSRATQKEFHPTDFFLGYCMR